jgi:hypothetical protein
MKPEDAPNPEKPAKLLKVHQQKGALFRVIHADGAWCSVGPYQNIHLAFYNERAPIPTAVYFALDEKNLASHELVEKREGKSGSFRELEVDVVISLEVARTLQWLLGNYIKLADDQLKDFEAKVAERQRQAEGEHTK